MQGVQDTHIGPHSAHTWRRDHGTGQDRVDVDGGAGRPVGMGTIDGITVLLITHVVAHIEHDTQRPRQ